MPPRAFNSLFGIPGGVAREGEDQAAFQLPFRDSEILKETIHLAEVIFQLPFRDSYKYVSKTHEFTLHLSTPFSGFPTRSRVIGHTSLLSTPFSGFCYGTLYQWIYPVTFQLPFRDSVRDLRPHLRNMVHLSTPFSGFRTSS